MKEIILMVRIGVVDWADDGKTTLILRKVEETINKETGFNVIRAGLL